MKIRSLLLGSAAVAGLSTGAFAADLGVMTSLDVCDSLGISGLTISSDDNCLKISGHVDYRFYYGDYDVDVPLTSFFGTGSDFNLSDNSGAVDWESRVRAWLKFVGTADSDFGPASATIVLKNVDNITHINGVAAGTDTGVYIDEAWVGIGDTTMIMAGKKYSLANFGDDDPLNWLGLFNSSANNNNGVGDSGVASVVQNGTDIATSSHVIQVVTDLGNGVSVGAGLEDLNVDGRAIGVLTYSGDTISAHATILATNVLGGPASEWALHAGLTATLDNFKLVGAIATDSTGFWNALGSASATFDMFTLAASVEATSANELGFGASAGATVSDGISLNLGFRWWDQDTTTADDEAYQVAAQLKAAVTETVTVVAEVGMYANGTAAPDLDPVGLTGVHSTYYAKGEIDWAPGGGFTSSLAGEVNGLGAYKATFKAAKDFQ